MIEKGRLSATRDEGGRYLVDPAELEYTVRLDLAGEVKDSVGGITGPTGRPRWPRSIGSR
jgi:hypothetical protein